MRKKKVLCWSDSAICASGFGVVSKYVLGALHATRLYDIDHLAINFHGDFSDDIPWNQQPARLLDAKDPHGIKMFERTLLKKDYDIVWICNDLYVTHNVAEFVVKFRQRQNTLGKKVPIFIYYYPVDCNVDKEAAGLLKVVDIPVCYTDHGKETTLKVLPELAGKLKQIPHGVDSSVFCPLTQNSIHDVKKNVLKVGPDTTVVLNFNRNSMRKQLAYSLLAFKAFKEYVPDSIMYMHTAVVDRGGPLLKAMRNLDLSTETDVIFPANYGPSNPVSQTVLNQLYNMGDIFLTTHLGEGWGLTVTEAMAACVPVVAPDNTSMPQLLGDEGERGYIYPCNDTIWIDSSGFRPKGLVPDIVEMMVAAYRDGEKYKNPNVIRARQWAVEHDWKEVTKAWVELFAKANSFDISQSTIVMGESV